MSDLYRSLIALGGNLGVTADTFGNACKALSEQGVQVMRLSSVVRTAAVGVHAGAEFLNAAAIVESSFEAPQLLEVLHAVEKQFGRERLIHWGPRTIDLDLLLFEQTVIEKPEIVVPHPAMWYRRFVLQPAAEIAGELNHPVLKQTVQELWARIQVRPLTFRICAPTTVDEIVVIEGQNVVHPVEHRTLEQLCHEWNGVWSSDQVRFVPTSDTSNSSASTEAFAILQLLLPGPAPRGTLGTGGKFAVHRRFTLDLTLDETIEQSVRDIVTSALG